MERTNGNGRYTDLPIDKLRGGYYTPPQIANWLARWAIRTPDDDVLEPSCGDGVFLEAAASRLNALRSTSLDGNGSLVGVEVIEAESKRARSRLTERFGDQRSRVHSEDFFAWWHRSKPLAFDVVIGNPPFIRYQSFPEPSRARAMELMAEFGLTPNRLTNIWVPFVVAAVASLRQGGRLALVLPAELLQVSYAAQLRAFLTDRFRHIDIVTCNELFFENAEQEVVLLLADCALTNPHNGDACRVAITEANQLRDLIDHAPRTVLAFAQPKTVRHDEEKWLKYFLSEAEIGLMRELREAAGVTTLSQHASVDVGVVTGKNDFFVLRQEDVAQRQIRPFTTPLVSRSIHLKGARLTPADWSMLESTGERVHLLNLGRFNGSRLNARLSDYIREGEAAGVHKGYKCSIREPWYAVPSVWNPDGFLFRQIYDFPRMVLNSAGATSTDTIHRVTCNGPAESVIANTYTYLFAASAEIEGRSYGGGVLELEPTEAERLLMPTKLGPAVPLEEADEHVRGGRILELLEENSRRVLRGSIGLSRSESASLREIWDKMRIRRSARRRVKHRSPNVREPVTT